MSEENIVISVGKKYLTRDGRTVCIFKKDTVFCRFECVVIGTGEFFGVSSNGSFYDSQKSHNDLVEEIK